tara:strand:+ start:677 stop:1132 length:456 start_codon:yes stop_codon:yes gene_type:complete
MKTEQFTILPCHIYTDKDLKAIDVSLFGILYSMTIGGDDKTKVSNQFLANALNKSIKTISSSIKRLVDAEYIKSNLRWSSNKTFRTIILTDKGTSTVWYDMVEDLNTLKEENEDLRVSERRQDNKIAHLYEEVSFLKERVSFLEETIRINN